MPREIARRCLPDIANAERVNEPGEGCVLRLIERVEQILCRFFPHALERSKVVALEAKEIGRGFHAAAVDELIHQLFAQTLDVQRSPRRKMEQRLLALGRAEQAAAAAR